MHISSENFKLCDYVVRDMIIDSVAISIFFKSHVILDKLSSQRLRT